MWKWSFCVIPNVFYEKKYFPDSFFHHPKQTVQDGNATYHITWMFACIFVSFADKQSTIMYQKNKIYHTVVKKSRLKFRPICLPTWQVWGSSVVIKAPKDNDDWTFTHKLECNAPVRGKVGLTTTDVELKWSDKVICVFFCQKSITFFRSDRTGCYQLSQNSSGWTMLNFVAFLTQVSVMSKSIAIKINKSHPCECLLKTYFII